MTATKTLDAIEAAIKRDQGAAYRQHLKVLLPQAEDAYEGEQDAFRSHLGASQIGKPCSRELWYGFRWVRRPEFNGQILRLFNRGHLEEPRMVAALLTIGCEVWQFDEQGKQFRITDHGGHFGSAIDGVVKGVPDMPDVPMLAEFKTHNEKSFSYLKANGMQGAKPEHYVQMQQYMGDYKLTHGLYLATNKNTDELYGEIIEFDPTNYEVHRNRAARVIFTNRAPQRISESAAWWQCKFCDFKDICHGTGVVEQNCRTCQYSDPRPDGKWYCKNSERKRLLIEGGAGSEAEGGLEKTMQLYGCPMWTVNTGIKA